MIIVINGWDRCECDAHMKTLGDSHLRICRNGQNCYLKATRRHNVIE